MTDTRPNSPEASRDREAVSVNSDVSAPSGKPSKRKPIPVKVQVSLAILQADGLICPLCRNRLVWDDPRVLEHLIPHATKVALGLNPDDIKDLAYVHKICADLKTYGNKATCADGDTHKIAKAKRLDRAREAHRAVLAGERTREPSRIKGRGFPKVHRPMQSRGWK